MEAVLAGALAMGFAAAGLFFLRFWRETRDRLFGLFAAAFWVMALNRFYATAGLEEDGARPLLYLLRLAAFVLILAAIADKNRARRRP